MKNNRYGAYMRQMLKEKCSDHEGGAISMTFAESIDPNS